MRLKIEKKQPSSKMCFVCGVDNAFGLKSNFYELEDGQLMAIFQPAEQHQGYPGRLHGGIAATILDETIGRAIIISGTGSVWGVTIDFSMKLRKPIPLNEEVRVLARVVSEKNRYFLGEGEIILADGSVAVTGQGKYLKMDIDKIADFDHNGEDWKVLSDANDPEFVDIPEKM
ncbi:MAG: thioesterase [Desulfotalea sp.]|nr:MAG: thioesterase [Desulfotalea sp.]